MRPFDELARFWHDTRWRMPHGSWLWAVAAVGGVTALALVATGSSEAPAEANAAVAMAPSPSCDEQTWPYFTDACLKRQQPAPPVRVLNYDQAMAKAAIGATPWAPKDKAAARASSRHKQGARDHDRSRKATVRSTRRDRNAQERAYQVPRDAYRAYGYAPR
jgi:hypothetical protein